MRFSPKIVLTLYILEALYSSQNATIIHREGWKMLIGEVAGKTGFPAKTIRFYGQIGLAIPASRSNNGYRTYVDRDVHVLQFLHRAR